MDKKDTFYWNDEKNRIDGFIPLDEENATRHAPDPEQAYKAYLEDAYSEYTDDAYEGPEEGPAFADVDSARQEADAAYGVQPQMQKKARKRKRPPRMVTMSILCLCIVLAAVTTRPRSRLRSSRRCRRAHMPAWARSLQRSLRPASSRRRRRCRWKRQMQNRKGQTLSRLQRRMRA